MDRNEGFRRMFKGAQLGVDDLLLLEPFQIAYLPGYVPEKEFSAILISKPEIKRFLVTKCPKITDYINSLLLKFSSSVSPNELAQYCDTVVWTIADLLVYNKCPEVYDQLPFHNWDFSEITSIVNLTNKIVIDGGSGTGRVALEAANYASVVYAVEPVARLREFIRSKSNQRNLTNLFVIDGFLNALPFPNNFADCLITSHALGWQLPTELREFERVVKKPGIIIHCPGTAVGVNQEEDDHQVLIKPPWSYEFSQYEETDGLKRKYWKKL